MNELGIEIRAGLQTGEIELRNDNIGGLAVHIASRVADAEKGSGVADALTVELGDKEMTVEQGNYKEKVFKNYKTKVEVGDMKVDIDLGSYKQNVFKDHKTTLKTGDHELDVKLGKSTISAMQKIEISSKTEIELKVGASSIKLDHTGVTIKGLMVKSEAQAMLDLKSSITQISGSAMLTAKGGITMIN